MNAKTTGTTRAEEAKVGKRVAIIGAGPGGLSAAIAFQQAGFHVRVFERHSKVKGLGGAIILNAIALNIMRSYGADISDTFTGHNQKFRSHDGRYKRVVFPEDHDLLRQAGATGWASGMIRSELYDRLVGAVKEGSIVPNHELAVFEDRGKDVLLHFANGQDYVADILIGADGIDSLVRQKLFGEGPAKHLGIAVWLGWTDGAEIDRHMQYMRHSDKHQFGYAPLKFQGADCVEWWFVEPCTETQPMPDDVRSYIGERIADFESPVDKIFAATELDEAHIFRWVVKWRDPLKTWTRGRVTLLGDAGHPTSPYASYGAGMALEDGFFLGRYFNGVDLSDSARVADAFAKYEDQRLKYTNKVTANARRTGWIFHNAPWLVRRIRDFLLNHTPIPNKVIGDQYTKEGYALWHALIQTGAISAHDSQPTGEKAENDHVA
ncbi:FAD-dependent oxidoreductase [Streptomyces sp. NBC_00582]|uniref:FAD-dependent oxidoreductase n=1 Tax=Streptomyces sp. NBC_00582 TaxID=2975783 RepID=UPI002E80D2BA|nr:NAD(P)/FAD-dependent oxidoreductase [Streptomyces sp. NBC_00582]WUB67440.1 FAD-dependent monooxygenase [Streptomyces sp. NBC_00582]